ncbi:response regulator [Labilibaculum euxinus]
MESKYFIVIDDKDQNKVINEGIIEKIRRDIPSIEYGFINLGLREFQTKEHLIDIDKVLERFVQLTDQKHIDLIACDYEFEGEKINGLDIIHSIRTLNKKVPIMLYSGKQDDVLKPIFQKYEKNKKPLEVFEDIKVLLQNNFDDFVDRPNYPNEIIRQIRSSKGDLNLTLLKKLKEQENLIFKSLFPKFEGQTLKQISNQVQKKTIDGIEFSEELLEQVISYLIKMN